MADTVGSIGVTVGADISQFTSDMGKAALIAQREMATVAQAQQQADRAAQKFIQSLKDEASTFGKTREQVLAYRAEQLGMTQQAQGYIDAIAKARKEQEALGNGLEHVGFQSAGAKRELLVLAHELSQGNYSRFVGSLMVIGERTNIMALAFSGAGLAILAAGAAVAGFVAAVVKGSIEQQAFNNALKLTNNYAGQTNATFTAIAQSAAQMTNSTIGAARSMEEAFVGSGRVGPDTLKLMTQTALEFQKVSGQQADEVVKDFLRMTDGVTKWAEEQNKQYHFLTLAQYEHIRALEEQGKTEQAEAAALQALHSQIQTETQNLGYFAQAWNWVKREAGDAIDVLKSWGREQDGVAVAQANLAAAQLRSRGSRQNMVRTQLGLPPVESDEEKQAQEALRIAQAAESQKEAAAAAKAHADATHQAAIEASKYYDNIRKSVDEHYKAQKALQEFDAQMARYDADGQARPAGWQKTRAELQASLSKKGTAEAGKEDKATLQQQVQQFQDALKAEQAALAYDQSYTQGLYQAGEMSTADYYAELRRLADVNAQAQQDTYAKEIAAQEQFIKNYTGKDKAAKVIETQTAIKKLQDEAAKAALDASAKQQLAMQKDAAAMRATEQQVREFNAQMLEQAGAFEQAAALRAQNAIERARVFAVQSGGQIDIDAYAREQQILAAIEATKKRLSDLDARRNVAESLYQTEADRSGASLIEQETRIRAIRQDSLAAQEALVKKVEEMAALAKPGDPITLWAAQLRDSLEKARDAVDPALTRLRDASKSAADQMADDVGSAITQWKGLKDLIGSIAKDLLNFGTKVLVTDPLKKEFEGWMRTATEGDNPIGNLFKSALGISSASATASTSSAALTELTTSAQAAATALARIAASAGISVPGGSGGFDFLGGSGQALFSQTDLGASGFGTGLAYGNMDYGGFFADGGNIAAGQWATVGENGPERIYVGRGGATVQPNQPANAAAASGGDMKLTIVNQTSAPIGRVQHVQVSPNERALIIQEAVERSIEGVAVHMYDANSKVSRAVGQNWNLRRSRS